MCIYVFVCLYGCVPAVMHACVFVVCFCGGVYMHAYATHAIDKNKARTRACM